VSLKSITFIVATAVLMITYIALINIREKKDPPKIRDLSNGAIVQRQRIDRSIELTKQLTIEETIANLSESNESYMLADFATVSSSAKGDIFINSMRGDRRVCKIFEHLLTLPQKEAALKAESIFDNQLPIFVEEWRKFAREGGLPNTGPHHHALSAGLFLCSYFSSTDALKSRIREWNEAVGVPEIARANGAKLFMPTRIINRLFLLNLLVISGERQRRSTASLNRDLNSICRKISGGGPPFLQVIQMRLYSHQAETTDTDFTYRTRGVPASGTKIVCEIPGFDSNHAALMFLNSDEEWSVFLATIEAWLER
jgi:hypothetical protein